VWVSRAPGSHRRPPKPVYF